jgi:hypothetical protein
MLWMGIWGHPYAVIHLQVGVNFRKMGSGRACMMLWCHGWGWNPPLTASHIHIGCIQSLSKDAVDECIATVNGTLLVIPHPTADDQPKCVAWKLEDRGFPTHGDAKESRWGKRYELDFCNACMLVAEVEGEIFIDSPASCGCPAVWYATALDCESC